MSLIDQTLIQQEDVLFKIPFLSSLLSGIYGVISVVDDSITVTQSFVQMCLAIDMDGTAKMIHNIKKIENNFGVGQFISYGLKDF